MSERETCWLVVENGEEFWGGNRTVPAITEAKRYIASEARVVAETLNAVFGGYDWQAVEHAFDPPKTPGQRFYEAARWFSAPRPEWGQLSIEGSAKYELAAAEFLAGEPKAESVAEAVLREREACAKIAEHPIAAISLSCTDPVSFAGGFRKAQELIVSAIRARGETWQEYLKQAVDRRQQGLR